MMSTTLIFSTLALSKQEIFKLKKIHGKAFVGLNMLRVGPRVWLWHFKLHDSCRLMLGCTSVCLLLFFFSVGS